MNAQKKNKSNAAASHDVTQVLTKDDLGRPEGKVTINPVTLSLYIRQLMQNWRQGTVASKGRSDVNFSNKKPWKQKGTGRARAGSRRSPLWKGGGTIFGPQPRTRTLKSSKKLRKGVLDGLLMKALAHDKIVCLNWMLEGDRPKTSAAAHVLQQANLMDKKITILLPHNDTLHHRSFMNIDHVQVVPFDEINAYDLAGTDVVVVLKKDLDAFKHVVNSWI